MTRADLRERAEIYLKQKTFVNIVEKSPSGKIRYYNGFILNIFDDLIMFKDHKLPQQFPIPLNSIMGDIEPSKQKREDGE